MPTIEDIGADGGEGTVSVVEKPVKPDTLAGLEPEPEDDDEDIDESLTERLLGLTEMFPDGLRSLSCSMVNFSIGGTQLLYSLGCSGMWVIASSATILALPVMFETERAQMEEQQLQQQRQMLLGPNAAVSGGGVASGLMPQVVPPQAKS